MEHAVETGGGPTATDPAGGGAATAAAPEEAGPAPEATDGTDATEDGTSGRKSRWQLPDWWHRDHPVFVPLAGFFTGMAFIVLVPGTYAAIVKGVAGYERAEELFPFVLLTLVVPIALIVPPRTRRFGRYMLFGVLGTAVVVIGVAVLVLYILFSRDGLDVTR